jgi:hypothetical protein
MTTTNTTTTTAEFYYVAPRGSVDRHLAGDADLNTFASVAEATEAAGSLTHTMGGTWDVLHRTESDAGFATVTVVATLEVAS